MNDCICFGGKACHVFFCGMTFSEIDVYNYSINQISEKTMDVCH